MRTRSPRAGNAVRFVLLALFVMLVGPFLLAAFGLFSYRAASSARADELRAAVEVQRAASEAQLAQRDQAQHDAYDARSRRSSDSAPPQPSTLRPVTETEYRTETFETALPVFNPITGMTDVKTVTETRVVPTIQVRIESDQSRPPHDPMIGQLTSELRESDNHDEAYERKLLELTKRLELEFAAMHESQAKQITETEERLDSLKKLHQQRGENKEKIVRRRIDELLGRADALQWEIQSPTPNQNEFQRVRTWNQLDLHPSGPGPVVPPIPSAGISSRYWQQQWAPPPSAPGTVSPVAPTAPTAPFAPRFTDPFAPPRPAESRTRNEFRQANPTSAFVPDDEIRQQTESISTTPRGIERIEEDIVHEERSAGGRWEASNGLDNRLFEIARTYAAALASNAAAQLEVDSLKGARNDSVVLRARQLAELHAAQVQAELDLSRMELDAASQSLQRELQFAEAQLANAQILREAIEAKHKMGIVPTDQVLKAQQDRDSAKHRLDQAKASLDQLNRARQLLKLDTPSTAPSSQTGVDPLDADSDTNNANVNDEAGQRDDTTQDELIPTIIEEEKVLIEDAPKVSGD